ncbi:dipeptidase PepE [Actinoalloteichus sp. AHMU CJ021]|uniref:Alpha-aspartyl dipeptidase, Serine peptidase, MEROPS family S51 n=1 Tax=Actinoalloteichus caeruleus DSM 43889 TaxID=1120930 RepID=A0ABT1JR27_ACTCY|nr:dipeptidase PepE [Actinoalloteichus caeruleus]AUS79954.1 dipeptidase PepE [Actinoalloteichus sp. AHMU CJ021]MCP2334136.1 alpha-aspartyl dipeptidase, Serine peptidase, MEROPS family S51 [Actinoalloteichus caeruleus DSM 43889]
MDLLLLSNSTNHGRGFLEHAGDEVRDFLTGVDRLVFVPYALADHDGYTEKVRTALRDVVEVVGAHEREDPREALAGARAVFVGGGNSFRLLSNLRTRGLLDALRGQVRSGHLRYMGASAGTNMACPSLRTTNDMPIVQPPSFETLGLVPFQINPHFLDASPGSTHMGETREQRIAEFHEENDVPVLGLREGAWARVSGTAATLGGETGAVLMERGRPARELAPGSDLGFLLDAHPRFDEPAR